jgi:hypothetical protein
MTPYTLQPEDFPIYRGAKWQHVLEMQSPDGSPLNLTGLGPFVLEFERGNGSSLGSATCTVDADPETGFVTVLLTAAQTLALPLGDIHAGMRDASNNPYFQGTIPVRDFTPTPAS